MKNNKFSANKFFILAMATMMMTACNKNHDTIPEEIPVTIQSADVTELSSRAGVPAGALTSGALSFWFYVDGDNIEKYRAIKEKWEYDATSQKWIFTRSDFDNDQLLWKGAGNTAKFYAMYPWNDIYQADPTQSGSIDLPADQSTAEKLHAADYLWAKGATASAVVNIEFTHIMTKFVINLTKGSEIKSDVEITNFTISEVPLKQNVTLATKTINGATESDAITPCAVTPIDGYWKTYEAIVSPSTYAPVLTITLNNGQVFTTTLNSQEFYSGYRYIIHLQVGEDTVTSSGISAAPCDSVQGGNLETE